ncbi:MAG: SMI1/KNR4 family protein [Pseudomonadota bacterium]
MENARFAQILRRMEASGIASPAQLRGCEEQEIFELEKKYNVLLPYSYRQYLQVMGHDSSKLFGFDHVAAVYAAVIDITADWSQYLEEEEMGPPASFVLPQDALLISERLGDQFEFIRCVDKADSTVWYFNTWDWEIRVSYLSVYEWLECWCGQSEDAIASGYFNPSSRGFR